MASRMHDWLTDTEAKSWSDAAILKGWVAGLQAAYLRLCHKLSGEKQLGTRLQRSARTTQWSSENLQVTINLKKRAGQRNDEWHQNTNSSKKRMFGDGNKDTCCFTGSTWQLLPRGVLTINCARDTNNTASRLMGQKTTTKYTWC